MAENVRCSHGTICLSAFYKMNFVAFFSASEMGERLKETSKA